jgi:ubiquinone/menaquinone biosynthesis C-methylase UbiE
MFEIGCGIGRMTRYLAEIFGEVHAADVSGEMVAQAHERLAHLKNVTVHETSGVDFRALPDDHFDVIFSAYVLQHVPSEEVVRANIREGYRILRPGGVFKFQVNSTVNREFEQTPKDTWTGVSFTEQELRDVARELGAQLVSMAGIGTQYTWTVFRKRPIDAVARAKVVGVTPQIVGFHFNDSDAPHAAWGSYNLRETFLTVFVEGVAGLDLDANQLSLKVAGHELAPCYVADASADSKSVVDAGIKADAALTLVHARVPKALLGATSDLQVCLKLETHSAPFTLELPPPKRVPPKIHLITNGADGAVDVYVSGPKSKVRLMTEGLEEGVTLDELMVRVGEWEARPVEIEYMPSNGLYYVNFFLPEGTPPGETAARVAYRGLWSDPSPLKLLSL